jgi:hypothetical protein
LRIIVKPWSALVIDLVKLVGSVEWVGTHQFDRLGRQVRPSMAAKIPGNGMRIVIQRWTSTNIDGS